MKSPQSLPKPKKPKLFAIRRVVGVSMMPTLMPDQIVFIIRRPFRAGDIVMFYHEGREKIKRVHKVADDQIYVLGDNTEHSTDSRHFGWVNVNHVQGRVVGKRVDLTNQVRQ